MKYWMVWTKNKKGIIEMNALIGMESCQPTNTETKDVKT
jgi:hypothetical protein